MEGIKQRLFQILQRHSGEPFPVAVVEVLARDALAEIERLEKPSAALEDIAKAAKSIDETLVLILHKLPDANP